jgi:hypothetical protein
MQSSQLQNLKFSQDVRFSSSVEYPNRPLPFLLPSLSPNAVFCILSTLTRKISEHNPGTYTIVTTCLSPFLVRMEHTILKWGDMYCVWEVTDGLAAGRKKNHSNLVMRSATIRTRKIFPLSDSNSTKLSCLQFGWHFYGSRCLSSWSKITVLWATALLCPLIPLFLVLAQVLGSVESTYLILYVW